MALMKNPYLMVGRSALTNLVESTTLITTHVQRLGKGHLNYHLDGKCVVIHVVDRIMLTIIPGQQLGRGQQLIHCDNLPIGSSNNDLFSVKCNRVAFICQVLHLKPVLPPVPLVHRQ